MSPTSTPATPAATLPEQRSVNTREKSADPNTAENDSGHAQSPQLPKLPHERDQSVDMTDGIPSPEMQQAYRDVERGLVDTDAGREAHNVGHPTRPVDPAQPGPPGSANPTVPLQPGKPGPIERDKR